MTKKSKKKGLSKRAQKLSLAEVNDDTSKVTIFKGKCSVQITKQSENGDVKVKDEKDDPCLPFLFEEPEWFRNIIVGLSEHLGILPQRVVY